MVHKSLHIVDVHDRYKTAVHNLAVAVVVDDGHDGHDDHKLQIDHLIFLVLLLLHLGILDIQHWYFLVHNIDHSDFLNIPDFDNIDLLVVVDIVFVVELA